MAIKSVLLGLICEEKFPSDYVAQYAVGLAAQENAHLAIGICAPKIAVASGVPITNIRGLIANANAERRRKAKEVSDNGRRVAQLAGVTATIHLFHDPYTSARDQLVRLARVNDLTVLQRSNGALSLEKDLAEQCLFTSGRPILGIPPDWKAECGTGTVVVAWDGSARAARAVGDAIPLLAKASDVEVVCVSEHPRDDKVIQGAEIAHHLSRHCKAVTAVDLSPTRGDVSGAILTHAKRIKANLIVMGGFAHSRFRQMLLGGVTQSMLSGSPLPTFLSY